MLCVMAASLSVIVSGVNLFSALPLILFLALILMHPCLGGTVNNMQHEIVSRLDLLVHNV